MRTHITLLALLLIKVHSCFSFNGFTQYNFCDIPFPWAGETFFVGFIHTQQDDARKDAKVCRMRDLDYDCSNRGWTHVPQNLPTTILKLNLFNNSLTGIANHTFRRYPALVSLSLAKNKISTLHVDSFAGLSRLTSLNLVGNRLHMNADNFPVGVFRPLPSLKFLCMQGNNDPHDMTLDYPGEALADLTSLSHLQMDGLELTFPPERGFGSEFQNLTKLTHLSLQGWPVGNCSLQVIQDTTFIYLSKLIYLNLANCDITVMSTSTNIFAPLTQLQVLDLSWNYNLQFSHLPAMLNSRMSTVTHLNLGYIIPCYSLGFCLRAIHISHLPQSLLHLDLSGNSIVTVLPEVFDMLPPNLTSLDIGNNRLVFGSYLQNMWKLEKLEKLYLDNDNNVFRIPSRYPGTTDFKSTEFSCSTTSDVITDPADSNSSVVFSLPPKLKLFSLNNCDLNYALTALKIDSNNSLEILRLDNNHLPFMGGPFSGFKGLKSFSAVNSRVEYIKGGFFSNFTSLVTLNLSSNILGIGLAYRPNDQIFKGLENLKLLNLSFNAIENSISHDFFEDLSQLEELYLQKNRFWDFDVKISHMKKLRVLNLSDTSLSNLPAHVRDHIDNLITHENMPFQLDMSRSPIWCTCDNLNFIKWIVDRRQIFTQLASGHYRCLFPNHTITDIPDGYEGIFVRLTRECSSKVGVFVFVLFLTLVVFSILIGLIIYRYRWKLRYFYYAVYLSITAKRSFSSQPDEFNYDVFVVYSADDETFIMGTLLPELEKRHLKLLVHGRDFVTGDFIASNIVTAVKDSRKTLVVLTRALVTSKWCNYELQMANVEAVFTGRSTLVFLQKETLSNETLGRELLCYLNSNTYITYPEVTGNGRTTAVKLEMFWDKLSNDLKR